MAADPVNWSDARAPPAGVSVSAFLELLDGLIDQLFVVFLRNIPLNELRSDHHRQVGRFEANLLQRPPRLELDLTLGIANDRLGLRPRSLLHLLAQPFAVGSALRNDGLRLDASLSDDPRRLLIEALQLLLRLLRIVQRLPDHLLAVREGLQERAPGK